MTTVGDLSTVTDFLDKVKALEYLAMTARSEGGFTVDLFGSFCTRTASLITELMKLDVGIGLFHGTEAIKAAPETPTSVTDNSSTPGQVVQPPQSSNYQRSFRMPVELYDPKTGRTIMTFPSQKAAGDHIGCGQSRVNNFISGRCANPFPWDGKFKKYAGLSIRRSIRRTIGYVPARRHLTRPGKLNVEQVLEMCAARMRTASIAAAHGTSHGIVNCVRNGRPGCYAERVNAWLAKHPGAVIRSPYWTERESGR